MSKELWSKATEGVEPDLYPLLGEEESGGQAQQPKSWTVRLLLARRYDEAQMAALSQDVDEVRFESAEQGTPLSSHLTVQQVGSEARVWTDLSLLKGVAEIRRLRNLHPEIKEWTLVSPPAPSDDPEALVGETIRQLTGLLAGCDVIEIQQGENEGFSTLWGRLGTARLLATEAELSEVPDTVTGSGFFSQMVEKLSVAPTTV